MRLGQYGKSWHVGSVHVLGKKELPHCVKPTLGIMELYKSTWLDPLGPGDGRTFGPSTHFSFFVTMSKFRRLLGLAYAPLGSDNS